MLGTHAEDLLERLNSFSAAHKSCGYVHCTTCGGKLAALEKSLSPETKQNIVDEMKCISFSELYAFDDWFEALCKMVPGAVAGAFLREAQEISLADVRALDRLIFGARRFRYAQLEVAFVYRKLFDAAMLVAISSKDSSLIATLLLILGKDVLEHRELLSLALLKKHEPEVGHVLYNTLREYLPEVRSFFDGK